MFHIYNIKSYITPLSQTLCILPDATALIKHHVSKERVLYLNICREALCISRHAICDALPQMSSVCTVCSLWEGIKAVGLLGVRKGNPHARGERGVEDDCGALITRSQVHRRHSANALAVHDHIFWPDPIPVRGTQNVFTLLVARRI